MASTVQDAPGAPGMNPKWTSSSKSGIGKSLNPASRVAFTISHGILNEVYYPAEDIASIRDMEFLVSDGKEKFWEEKRDTLHKLRMVKDGVPAYIIKNTAKDGSFEIVKEIVTDPIRDTVLQRITFNNTDKKPFKLYCLLAPHINNQGFNSTGWVGAYKGVPMVFAQNGDISLALACSTDWIKRSVGYVGRSDGWTDLNQNKEMQWEYARAELGNFALTGEIDLAKDGEIVVALSFGRSIEEAGNHARASLLDGFDKAQKMYVDEWIAWQDSLNPMNSKYHKVSAAVLRVHEASSFPGGIIASLSIPWGDDRDDSEHGGYHLVWPRDLALSSGGFLAMGAHETTLRIINYLMSTQNADGSWPQNMWLDGESNWTGLQLDQVAMPILETYKAFERGAISDKRMKRYWPLIKKAIVFLLKTGPYTEQDRWEEEHGFTPFTISTQISALLAGAAMANANGEKRLSDLCFNTADQWNGMIEKMLYVTDTNLANVVGVDGYYIRINPFKDLSANDLGDRTIHLKNHDENNGIIKITELVSVDALALVRFGLRDAKDPKILNTLKVIDTLLKVETPKGLCWRRYNHDGYGEHENGDSYDGTGIGRAWPLLTGERAHYEVAAGNFKNAEKLMTAMNNFSNNGLLPEQIWDAAAIPEKRLYPGEHTGSVMPLTWAHAEYIKLCASLSSKKVFDMPSFTQARYANKTVIPQVAIWSFKNPISEISPNTELWIQTNFKSIIIWTDDNWESKQTSECEETKFGLYITAIKSIDRNSKKIVFTIYWVDDNKWENKNFEVKIIESNKLSEKKEDVDLSVL